MTTDVVCVGECMLELRHLDERTLRLGYAGDTYNTAVYLRRVATELGLPVAVGYLSGVGDDTHSTAMRAAWAAEGIADLAVVVPGKRPGIYIIDVDEHGEREFGYWRSESAARVLFGGTAWLERLAGDVIYLSGITLQLTTPVSRKALDDRLDELRRAGTRVVLDTNYRAAGWSTPDEAAAAIDEIVRHADTVLASLTDEVALHGPLTPLAAAERLAALGPTEIVVKAGADGAWLHVAGQTHHLPAVGGRILDTTAAGDSFAAAYLAGRLAGRDPLDAATLATRVAAVVIGHTGAILPPDVPLARGAS